MKTMHPLILNSALAIALLTGTALCPNAFAAEPGAQAEAAKPAAQGEMIAGGDGTKLFLRRDLPDGDVRAVLVIVHGLANHHDLYDNLAILDFALSDADMAALATLDKGVRYYNRTDEQLVQFAAWHPAFEKA